ncbi:NAD-dependent epimerase/dehydratase family protein [Aquimarina aquimarini]|uniref:NAD-dependent epimerase/dehydratase family protein n=1 Tax=Aquimarina aquimarini TaxID=1191734 RepID=UPI000D5598E3|nr:NAD-dependent epimerase/dehydratase family protein [Aquimarina aquimarini]
MKNVFITGGTGFIGSNLCRYLYKKGYNISVGIRENADLSNLKDIEENIVLYNYTDSVNELASFLKEQKIDVVFHLASCFIAEHKPEDVNSLINSNLLFGTFLLEAMRIAEVKKLINTGTSWQHFNNESYNPVCLYAATKDAFERIITYYYEAEGLSCITLKLFDSYSENDTRPKLINLLNQFSKEGKVLDMSGGEQEINLLHADDICMGFESAYEFLNEKSLNEKYTLVAKETITLKKLIEIFNSISESEIIVNWGEKPYRKREVMKLWSSFEILPNWTQKISLKEGLNRLFNK